MKFSKKRTCKSCQIAGESCCIVKKETSFFKADIPLEPCFKPTSSRDWSKCIDSMLDIQNANLKVLRATE